MARCRHFHNIFANLLAIPSLVSALIIIGTASLAAAQAQPVEPAEGPPIYGPPNPFAELRSALATTQAHMAMQDAELARLRSEIEAERQRARSEHEALTRELQLSTRRAEELLQTSPLVRAGGFGLSLSGFVHADLVYRQSSEDQLNGSSGEPLNETRFLIRRARLRTTANYRYIAGALEVDANTLRGSQARLIGAEVSLGWPGAQGPIAGSTKPWVQATIGSFKMPFGLEVPIESDTQRHFAERSSVVRALFPGEYDLGIRLQGGWRFLHVSIAAMNGNPIGDRSFPLRDPNGSKDFLGRLGIDTAISKQVSVAAGISGLRGTGFDKGSAAAKDVPAWRDLNENGSVESGELQFIAGTAAIPAMNFDRFAVGGDLRLRVALPRLGQLMLYGEVIYASNLDRGLQPANPITAGRDLREFGWFVGFTQELTRHGMIGVRYDTYNPDSDASERQVGTLVPIDVSVSTLAVAASWRSGSLGRLIVEWDHNRNAYGRDITGLPTNLKDDAFTLRAEVVY